MPKSPIQVIRPMGNGFNGSHLNVTKNDDGTVNVQSVDNSVALVVSVQSRQSSDYANGNVVQQDVTQTPVMITTSGAL